MLALACSLLVIFPIDPTEAIILKPTLNARDWAVVANRFIELGQKRGVAKLKENDAKASSDYGTINQRKALLCRILFLPKGTKPLRQPPLGYLFFPTSSMPASLWPEFPLVQQSGAWFLLTEAYAVFGKGRPLSHYIDECVRLGRFRTMPLMVPTESEAKRALDELLRSERWAKIQWDAEEAKLTPEKKEIEYLKSQTKY